MKNMTKILFVLAIVLAIAATPALAQTHPTRTTLSVAMARTANTITVASATGITAGSGRYVLIEEDMRPVTAVSGTLITLGASLTAATGHVSGTAVIYGQQGNWTASGSTGTFLQSLPKGSCTRGNSTVLPAFFVDRNGGSTVDCLGGSWVRGVLPDATPMQPLIAQCNVNIGDVAYTSLGTSEDDVANKRMVTSFYLPHTVTVTGVTVLQGTTATTDNITSGVHDSAGNPIVNTGATGVLLATASTFKNLPFTANATGAAQTTTILVGPHNYFVTVNANGATAEALRLMAASTYNNILSAGTTSVTFGTFAAFTPPTTFTATLAPFLCLYR